MGEDQLAKGVEMFADMDDAKLDMAVNVMQKAQKAKDVWVKADTKTGGHLMKILILLFILTVGVIVQRLFFTPAPKPVPSFPAQDIPNIAVEQRTTEEEYESEF
jgi:hypothetical protein